MSASVQTTDQANALDLAELLAGPVVGPVVDHDDLVAVGRGVERAADAVELVLQVALLVVDGKDDGDVELRRWIGGGAHGGVQGYRAGVPAKESAL
jgi:hypothetical protein